ncbi:MAG: crosslink repair DNA glycosylase YcaQ family protein, partial [Nocardioides sp.]|nr:crosslink repair DNA glycosylase YcaQ family protein [Nocardioides sp.]
SLDGGGVGHLLPDDVEPEPPVDPWAALLPVLDPTTMGWKHRGFYLGDHRPLVFDRNGNAGTTAWWDGRVVGAWHQDASGAVVLDLLDEVGAAARRALEREAARLTRWLAGERVGTVYPSPLMRAHAAGSPATAPTP